ncbi:hypothetical protein H8D36_06775 [archaeon]|nr:hypothetical protein [archaeon]MBL7057475.1 hypothetical protein [Candidatus Woesearchaeota archaeon]
MEKNLKLDSLVRVPRDWVDLKQFKHFEGGNFDKTNWANSYLEYQNEIALPWIRKIQQLYGDKTEINEFEDLNEEHYNRVQSTGVVDLTCGFYISIIKTSQLDFIPTSVPIKYLTDTINILPHLMQVQKNGVHIPLSSIVDTKNGASITETGILLPPGEQIMIYTIEEINMPENYIGQITTKSGIGRRGLDTVATAGTLNPGWKGVPILEANNRNLSEPILIELGVPIAQFYLIDASHSKGKYDGEFQNQKAGS